MFETYSTNWAQDFIQAQNSISLTLVTGTEDHLKNIGDIFNAPIYWKQDFVNQILIKLYFFVPSAFLERFSAETPKRTKAKKIVNLNILLDYRNVSDAEKCFPKPFIVYLRSHFSTLWLFSSLLRTFLGDKRFRQILCHLKAHCLGSQKTLIWLKPFISYGGLLAPKNWALFCFLTFRALFHAKRFLWHKAMLIRPWSSFKSWISSKNFQISSNLQ